MTAMLQFFTASGALHGDNAAFIEDIYERYRADPASVEPLWRERFDALSEQLAGGAGASTHALRPAPAVTARLASQPPTDNRQLTTANSSAAARAAEKQSAVLALITGYRYRGHQVANLDPIKLRDTPDIVDLDPAYHGLEPADLDRVFHTGSLYAPDRLPLREIIAIVAQTYCGTVGSEYLHITTTLERRWIQKRLEGYRATPELDTADRHWLLKLLSAAEGFETYLHQRFVGQKRFSLEGGDALIPLLDELIQRAGRNGQQEIVIGMAHRGRLNVLTNIFGKPPQEIFDEFEGRVTRASACQTLAGDVKYHMGFATDLDTPGGAVHLALGFNPSHLEIINPVIEGSVRARQRRRGDRNGEQVLPVLIHGDAAFAGQGVVMETLQLSQTRSYNTGGTVHIIINNQIGFTTSHPLDARSSAYCSDVGKLVAAPVFHVNGDDPEAVIFVTRMALDFRNQFHKDVVIDLVCYRRRGHNEADEPAVTQPLMYQKIRQHPTPRSVYAERLIAAGVIEREAADALVTAYRDAIAQGVVMARPVLCGLNQPHRASWDFCRGTHWDQDVPTGVPLTKLHQLTEALLRLPPAFVLHPLVDSLWHERRRMGRGEIPLNWGMAETLAYASLLDDGIAVRLSGQDAGRGTFSHRHANLHDQRSGTALTPLQWLHPQQGAFIAIDSILSEEAVLGYEYGFATAEPHALTLWEAQFGDFANGAQVVIDQFITSGGSKWGLDCGLVLLLPHGLEGQGAEHSSARLERFLQLCAEHNIQVCAPTTPAQLFHLLRRQVLRNYRKPLIVMTPKSLLRHPLAVSALDELAQGQFQPVLPEVDALDPAGIERLIFCSGKVYFELLEARRAQGLTNVAIVRIEQLYPFPKAAFADQIDQYAATHDVIWCQEEAQNQGAWDQIKHRLHHLIQAGKRPHYVGRPAAAAPAVGHRSTHLEQQERLLAEALTGHFNPMMNKRIPPQ